jgi:hypothetical protein
MGQRATLNGVWHEGWKDIQDAYIQRLRRRFVTNDYAMALLADSTFPLPLVSTHLLCMHGRNVTRMHFDASFY